MLKQDQSALKACSPLPDRDEKPSAHADLKSPSGVRLVNGRIVSKTLADPDVQGRIRSVEKKMFPDQAAVRKEMYRRGVMTASGKVSKKYGG